MQSGHLSVDAFLDAFEPPLRQETAIRLEVNLHMPEPGDHAALHVALRVGTDRLYVVRSISAFLRAWENKEHLAFGKGFALDPENMCFEGPDRQIIEILQEACPPQDTVTDETGKVISQPVRTGKFLGVGEAAARRILRILMARPFRLAVMGEMENQEPIAREKLPVTCALRAEGAAIALGVEMPQGIQPVLPDYEFARVDGHIVQLSSGQRRAVRALTQLVPGGRGTAHFAADETQRVVSEVLPHLERDCMVSLDDTLSQRIRREPFKARAYIDRDGQSVVARVEFLYGEMTIDPFAPVKETPGEEGLLLVRDAVNEWKVLDALAHAGFHVERGHIHLSEKRRVLNFVMEGVTQLQQVCEVFASEDFKRLKPRRPRLTGQMRMSGGVLELTMMDDDTPIEELADLMRALRDKKRYFRLKNGDFLDLSGMDEWQEISEMLGDAEENDMPAAPERPAETPVMTLRAYRSAYLVSLLQMSGLPIAVDDSVKNAAAALGTAGDACPESLAGILRPYQLRGFEWLQSLVRLKMGGVLADDMGLGKTLQVIATLVWAREKLGAMPSIVVAPTSLVYNWQAELARFAPQLKSTVIEGGQRVRFLRWAELKQNGGVDVIITSYPLLRRDIEQITDFPFRMAVLDEAQHIKNPQSLSAVAADKINAETRIALTGTPMENSPGELWSIFNFALPGYLMTLSQFMRRHGDGSGADVLRRRIRPFLLRRLKSDVLPELPEKIESRVLCDMPPEQKNVYMASAMQLKERVERVLDEKGIGRGRMEVLSALTQLRQICCHPSLVMTGYAGSSGKMDALIEILGNAMDSGRRVLLFSQFTSMLAILKRTLERGGISTMYLDGKTPVGQRLELVNRFNAGEGSVFLISLKAGGAGLNLTGADTVIHYDPWWNPAAEDQATDRAHRIGQQHTVQVIRLITRGTIEEQVAKLSERKRALFDAVVTAGEQMPSEMTGEEILGLFAQE